MTRFFFLFALFALVLPLDAAYTARISLNKKDGIYKVGQNAICRVVLLKDKKPLKNETARVSVRWENKTVEVYEFVTDGKPLEFTYRGMKPGWVYFGVEILDEKGNPRRGNGVFKHRMKPTIVTEIGAMFDPDKIISCVREPADFDEFWKKRREEVLKMVPLKAELTELDSSVEGIRLFGVSVPGPRNIIATGYLAYPAGAKPGTLKATVEFQSMTQRDATRKGAIAAAKKGNLGFFASWHGFPVGKSVDYYKKVIPPYYQRGFRGIDNREKWVCSDTFFRVMMALEFIKSHPLWNGRDLLAMGGSYGGIQTIFAAAIDPQVTLALVAVPSFCECNAFEAGRTPNGIFRRIPVEKLKKNPKYLETGFYFDAVNFAKRIRCEIFVCTGFADEACMPSNVFAFYNTLPATTKKMITTNPRTGHYGTTKDANARRRFEKYGESVTIGVRPEDEGR